MNDRPTLRRCISCRELVDRRLLWRVIRLPGNAVVLDRGMGRSAYLCPTRACLLAARRQKRLQRALRAGVEAAIYDELEQRLEGATPAAAEAR